MTKIHGTIQLKTEETAASDLVLGEGRPLYETSTDRIYVGDGTRTIAQLDTACDFFSKQGYKEYVALLSDPGDIIAATVLKNELGGTVVWTEDGGSGGNHIGTLASAFPSGRTVVLCGSTSRVSDEVIVVVQAGRLDNNTVQVRTFLDGTLTGELLDQTTVIVRVYPA